MSKYIIRYDSFLKQTPMDQGGLLVSYERELEEIESSDFPESKNARKWIKNRKKAIDRLYSLIN
jgi:hypothetical protein